MVNAASYAQPIAPGSIVAIFGANLAASAGKAEGSSLPTELAGTTVTVNGNKAGLFYVSPTQINLEVPTFDVAYAAFTDAILVVTTAAGSSAPVKVRGYSSSPALFTADTSGCGQAAALNVTPEGAISINSPSNSAAPGDYIALYGTGIPGAAPGLYLDGISVTPTWSGAAPTLEAVQQINFRIPEGAREACAVPIQVENIGMTSPRATVSIHSGRGACVDPPVGSYGQITLTKTVTTGTSNDGTTEVFSAAFPSAPGLKAPVETLWPPFGGYAANGLIASPVSRACKVETALSAGVIAISNPNGPTVSVQPQTTLEGATYTQTLPNGFIAPATVAIASAGGAVTIDGSIAIPAPIQIQTTIPPGTKIAQDQPLVINWTGGRAGDVVKVSLISVQGGGVYSQYDYGYADAASGTFTFAPLCMGNHPRYCTMGLPASQNAQVIVEASPGPGGATPINAQGITGAVQASWVYRYVFGGLSIQ